MSHYSDPTAQRALGNINREFSQQVKKARRLRRLYEAGRISAAQLEAAHDQFRGIYKHVLENVLKEEPKEEAPRIIPGR